MNENLIEMLSDLMAEEFGIESMDDLESCYKDLDPLDISFLTHKSEGDLL